MKIRFINGLLFLVFGLGILGAGSLVLDEISLHNVCPELLSIPACFIILACFIISMFSHLLKWNNSIYFVFTGLASSIALIASILQFIEKGECPKTANGIPMCYFSLLLFLSLIVLKLLFIRNATKNL